MAEAESIEISVAELAGRAESGEAQIVDVRTDKEWAEGRITGSRHIELNDVSTAAESFDRGAPIIFVCSAGNRSSMAAEAFRTAGFEAYSLAGGLEQWTAGGHGLESE
ncbi:MAG: rhodanese-like domain-containing protein [Solirubrobacterales bacterium]